MGWWLVADGLQRVFHKLLLPRKTLPWHQGSEVRIGRLVGDHGKGTVNQISRRSYASTLAVQKCTTWTLKISSISTTAKMTKLYNLALTRRFAHWSQESRKEIITNPWKHCKTLSTCAMVKRENLSINCGSRRISFQILFIVLFLERAHEQTFPRES